MLKTVQNEFEVLAEIAVSDSQPNGPCKGSQSSVWSNGWLVMVIDNNSSHVVCSAWKGPERPQTVQQE